MPAITLVAASYAGYNKMRVIFMFTLTMGFLGNFFSGAKVNALDLSPNYAGSLMALTNGLAGLAGVGVLPAIGVLTPDVSVKLKLKPYVHGDKFFHNLLTVNTGAMEICVLDYARRVHGEGAGLFSMGIRRDPALELSEKTVASGMWHSK